MVKVGVTVALVSLVLASLSTAQVRQGQWTPVVESMERGYSSISYWTYRDDGVEIGGGRISVEHGKPAWPESLNDDAMFDAATVDKVWRLGNNKWTVLDTQLTLTFGERVVTPGIYYLVLERPTPDEWRLGFVSPEDVRGGLIDAWAAAARPAEVPRSFAIPLRYSPDQSAKELDMTLSLQPDDMGAGGLAIQWGPHRLDVSFSIDVASPTFYREGRGTGSGASK